MTKAALAVALLVAAFAVTAQALDPQYAAVLAKTASEQLAEAELLNGDLVDVKDSVGVTIDFLTTLTDETHRTACETAQNIYNIKLGDARSASDDAVNKKTEFYEAQISHAMTAAAADTNRAADAQTLVTLDASIGHYAELRARVASDYTNALLLTDCDNTEQCQEWMSSDVEWGACYNRECELKCIQRRCTLIQDDKVVVPALPVVLSAARRRRVVASMILLNRAAGLRSTESEDPTAAVRLTNAMLMFHVLKPVDDTTIAAKDALIKVQVELDGQTQTAFNAMNAAQEASNAAERNRLEQYQVFDSARQNFTLKCGEFNGGSQAAAASLGDLTGIVSTADQTMETIRDDVFPDPVDMLAMVWRNTRCSSRPSFCSEQAQPFELAMLAVPGSIDCDLATFAPTCVDDFCACHAPTAAQRGRWALRF